VLTARRVERLESLALELKQRHGTTVTVLPYDLADPDAPRWLCEQMEQQGLEVDWLVNNAGYGVPGTFDDSNWEVLANFLQVLLIKFSQSLALENAHLGVHVSALCPGFTWSEFHDVTQTRDKMDKLPDYMWLTSDEVVRQGIDAVERGDSVYIPGKVNRFIKTMIQLMPDKLAQSLSARQATRYRNTSI
jgi:short-subunit dehydrogenase